jgi:hypothetical protein
MGMTTKKKVPKRYVTIRIDTETYEAIRTLVYKKRSKIITFLRQTFVK